MPKRPTDDKVGKTDYQQTYYKKNIRPRSSKKPPPSPRDRNPPPMTFDTFQRSVFVPKDIGVRAKPVVIVSIILKMTIFTVTPFILSFIHVSLTYHQTVPKKCFLWKLIFLTYIYRDLWKHTEKI